jgi:hypothetical protein
MSIHLQNERQEGKTGPVQEWLPLGVGRANTDMNMIDVLYILV